MFQIKDNRVQNLNTDLEGGGGGGGNSRNER